MEIILTPRLSYSPTELHLLRPQNPRVNNALGTIPKQQPPAQPAYILRGHSSPIHATIFIRRNTRLVTGDADGWVVVWDLVTKRPVAVWRAHEGVILGLSEWSPAPGEGDRLITHGKDNLLLVWRFSEPDEEGMSTVLPVDVTGESRRKPWLVYSLQVNTMNYCAFSCCRQQDLSIPGPVGEGGKGDVGLLIAVPNILTSETVDIFHLPTAKRLHTIPNDPNIKTGMIMAVSIFYHPVSGKLTVVIGYESGYTAVAQLNGKAWKTLYLARCHDQPILSLNIDPLSKEWFLTSSADATIAKHPIPDSYPPVLEDITSKDKAPDPPPSTTTPAPTTPSTQKPSPISLIFASSRSSTSSERPHPRPRSISQIPTKEITPKATPITINKTKHSGQQSLRIRSDGKIFATAGWDSKFRIYSTKTLKEIAVLKWHGVGCFAVDFADVNIGIEDEDGHEKGEGGEGAEGERKELATVSKSKDMTRDIKAERLRKIRMTHWVAGGSKDGKVSLWDIY